MTPTDSSLSIDKRLSTVKFYLIILLSITSIGTQAASGPTIIELSNTLNSTWQTLLLKTHCNRPPPQDSQCIQAHHGKTITVKLFGEKINALILFETTFTADVSGTIVTQQSGFLIGPINGYAYKTVNEIMTSSLIHKRRTRNNGLKVYAYAVKITLSTRRA